MEEAIAHGVIDTPGDLGRIVAYVRSAANLSQDELAARLGISQRYLSELERGLPKKFDERFIGVLNRLGIRLTVEVRTNA